MKAYLLIDFGSTYTKLTAVDIESEEVLAVENAITTIESDIMVGFNNAYEKLISKLSTNNVEFIKKLACSSAAGGLKMIAIGLVPELTGEAAKRAALGAGARVLKTYSHELSSRELQEIKECKLDIILLAGGTDGGNKDCIINNARKLVEYRINIPIVVAGNKTASDEVEEILKSAGFDYRITENVMPKLNFLNVEPAREEIRKVFMDKIVEAKGMKNAESFINGILMPTPAAVIKASEILSIGSDKEEGIGELIVVDIGGATTDIHSIASGEPSNSGVTLRGLQEPFAKRTVEGDLGMRYSALALWEVAGTKAIGKHIEDKDTDIEKNCRLRTEKIEFIADSKEAIEFDEAMAKVAIGISMERHVGIIESMYTPMGAVFTQIGKDLMNVNCLIGTGGILANSRNSAEILKAGTFDTSNSTYLKPKEPLLLLDKDYIMWAMGLLAQDYPDLAVRMMKKYLLKVS